MNREDIICLCGFVFKDDIIKSGIKNYKELQLKLNIGLTCGKCEIKTKEFLNKL